MSALQRMNQNLSPRAPEQSTKAIAPERPLSADRPAEAPAPATAQFLPLDPDIVSEAIPAFFIGRNKEGFWVARDANGRLAEFSCSRAPHCRLQDGTARQDAQQYFHPAMSSSISRTRAIPSLRCSEG
jgi:hypothetical protein